jgi:hypothetical protein
MVSIDIKRAYDRPSPKDGKRILVDRLWPRGLRKDTASLDLWSKDIAPSSSLRMWFDHRAESNFGVRGARPCREPRGGPRGVSHESASQKASGEQDGNEEFGLRDK